MCICTPSIKSPWCLKCRPASVTDLTALVMNTDETFEEVKRVVKVMDGLSEDGFNNRYLNDPAFNKAIRVLVNMISKK